MLSRINQLNGHCNGQADHIAGVWGVWRLWDTIQWQPCPVVDGFDHSSSRVLSLLAVATSILVLLGPALFGQILGESWMARVYLSEVRTVLNSGADLVEADAQGRTALPYAVSNEDAGITDLWLRYGADIDAADFMGSTPVHLAASGNRNHSVVETLVRFGANFAARDTSVRAQLELATVSNPNSSVLDSLRELGSTSESLSGVPISRLIYSDRPNSVTIDRLCARPSFSDVPDIGIHRPQMQEHSKGVVQHNRDPSVSEVLGRERCGAGIGREPATACIASSRAQLQLGGNGPPLDLKVPVNVTDGMGQAALQYFATNPNPAGAALLLDQGAEVDAQDGSGGRVLHATARNPNPAGAGLLMPERERHGAVASESHDWIGRAPLTRQGWSNWVG